VQNLLYGMCIPMKSIEGIYSVAKAVSKHGHNISMTKDGPPATILLGQTDLVMSVVPLQPPSMRTCQGTADLVPKWCRPTTF
jgi:hypothetical protein